MTDAEEEELNLYNFDLPQHTERVYILTSPRSLAACKQLNIKPVDLLPQSREEFMQDNPHLDPQERKITYLRHEKERLQVSEESLEGEHPTRHKKERKKKDRRGKKWTKKEEEKENRENMEIQITKQQKEKKNIAISLQSYTSDDEESAGKTSSPSEASEEDSRSGKGHKYRTSPSSRETQRTRSPYVSSARKPRPQSGVQRITTRPLSAAAKSRPVQSAVRERKFTPSSPLENTNISSRQKGRRQKSLTGRMSYKDVSENVPIGESTSEQKTQISWALPTLQSEGHRKYEDSSFSSESEDSPPTASECKDDESIVSLKDEGNGSSEEVARIILRVVGSGQSRNGVRSKSWTPASYNSCSSATAETDNEGMKRSSSHLDVHKVKFAKQELTSLPSYSDLRSAESFTTSTVPTSSAGGKNGVNFRSFHGRQRPASAMERTTSRPYIKRPSSTLSNRFGSLGSLPTTPRGSGWTPRGLLASTRSSSTVSLAESPILMKQFQGFDISMEVPWHDRHILELLTLKHMRDYEEEQKSYRAHREWTQQRIQDHKLKAIKWAAWQEQVNAKRRLENEENDHRWKRSQELYFQSQENIANIIRNKEQRSQELLHDQFEARIRKLEEKRSCGQMRKAAQEISLREKEKQEELQRQRLIQLWDHQQKIVEKRKWEREEAFRKRLVDGSTAEVELHEKKRRQVEAQTEALLLALRRRMEEKFQRSDNNLMFLWETKEDDLRRKREEHQRKANTVKALHNQLEADLLKWRQHILAKQIESMATAENRLARYLQEKSCRIHSGLESRQEHHQGLYRQVRAREEAHLQAARRNLEAKDLRSQEVKRERERRVNRARETASVTSTLRECLKNKFSPDTFDKMVARANLELRIENRMPSTRVKLRKSNIFLG